MNNNLLNMNKENRINLIYHPHNIFLLLNYHFLKKKNTSPKPHAVISDVIRKPKPTGKTQIAIVFNLNMTCIKYK
jgi:hypothetical protein